MAEEIRVVELFAGVGGFRCGLEAASDRFVTVWANQWEPGRKNQFAFDCYQRHFGNTGSVNVNEDIALVKGDVPEDIGLLVGGFPCQDYSVATTNAKGIQGKKGVLWWYINDIIASRKPQYVLLENVDRLLKSPASQRGRDFGVILRCLADLGYTVEWRVINAADYGLVQKRRRTFIFASREDSRHSEMLASADSEDVMLKDGFFARTFPVSASTKRGLITTDIGSNAFSTLQEVSDEFHMEFRNSGYMVGGTIHSMEVVPEYDGPRTMLKDILVKDADPSYSEEDHLEKWKVMKGSKHMVRVNKKTGIEYNYSEGAIPFPDHLDAPGRTMLTSEGSRNRSSHLIKDPVSGLHRVLTPVECERMNGFPDGWTEGMTDSQRYFTMGNALVVGLITEMGKTILEL